MVRGTPASWASTTGLRARSSELPEEAQEAASRSRRGRWGRKRRRAMPSASVVSGRPWSTVPRRLLARLLRPDESPARGDLERLARGLVGVAGIDAHGQRLQGLADLDPAAVVDDGDLRPAPVVDDAGPEHERVVLGPQHELLAVA